MKNKSKNKDFSPKKVIHIIVCFLMIFALFFGIVFSAIQTKNGLELGSQYRGGFQAIVGVYDSTKNTAEDEDPNLPNGDASAAAGALESKLSPFSDGSVNVKITGRSRLTVTVPRDMYSDNEQLFKNAIQSSGGLFVLNNSTNQDIMFDKDLMTKIGISDPTKEGKIATGEILGNVSTITKQVGVSNQPYLNFDLKEKNDYWSKIVAAETDENGQPSGQAPSFKLVSDMETLLNSFREYYSLSGNKESEKDKFAKNYFSGVIDNLKKYYNDSKIDSKEKLLLSDFFYGTYHFKIVNSNQWTEKSGSLMDDAFIKSINTPSGGSMDIINSVDDMKKFLFADGTTQHRFTFANDITKYIYDTNSVAKDFALANDNEPAGRYSENLKSAANQADMGVRVDEAFKLLTNIIFTKSLLASNNSSSSIVDTRYFDEDIFRNHFLYFGSVDEQTSSTANPTSAYIDSEKTNFLLRAPSYTFARTVTAAISQTTQGLRFHVFSITSVDAEISQAMFITSLVFLIIIALAAAIFMLFFYRLLGLFTIVVALAIGSLSILTNVLFGVTMGPEMIATLFVVIGLTIDVAVIFFEALKNNMYIEKRPIKSSFKIGNRETLGLVIDVALTALIPNVVLFWIGTGALRNFATITTMGILFVLLIGIVLFRILLFFLIRTDIFNKYSWLLPVNTSLDYKGSFINSYLIEINSKRLDDYSKKEKLSSKELIKIKKLQDRINILNDKQIKIEKQKELIKQNKAQKLRKYWDKQIKDYEIKKSKIKKENRISFYFKNWYDRKIDYLKFLLNPNETNFNNSLLNKEQSKNISLDDNKNNSASDLMVQDRLIRTEKLTSRIGSITVIVTIFMLILASIVGVFAGFNYSSQFGKGTTYYIYGDYVDSTFEQMADPLGTGFIDEQFINDSKAEEIAQTVIDIHDQSITNILNKYGLTNESELTPEMLKELHSTGVAKVYDYIISNKYFGYIYIKAKDVSFSHYDIKFGTNYAMLNPENVALDDNLSWVSIYTTSNLIPTNNAIKISFQRMAGEKVITNKPVVETENHGVLGMNSNPHTAYNQMKQILITFGIILLALLIYMILRFKWTYYVAMAIGLVVSLALIGSMVVVFRVPVSIEILSGIIATITFAVITGMLILGKGKSIISSKDEKDLNEYFEKEIDLHSQIKELNRQFKNKIRNKSRDYKIEIKKLNKKDSNYKIEIKKLRQELKVFKLSQKTEFKELKHKINEQIAFESRKNNFLKQIFDEVLKFGIIRSIFVGMFYIAIGFIAAVTLPTITGMGIVITLGVIISTIVTLSIVLPIWIMLEKRRIRTKYGYKKFVNNLKVSAEEQVIKGLND